MAGHESARHPGGVDALRRTGHFLLGLPRLFVWILVAGWMSLIWFTSSQPGEPGGMPAGWAIVFNFGHAPVFGFLALLLAAVLLRSGGESRAGASTWPRIGARETLWILGAVGLYGLLDEWHQSAVVGRHSSVMDLITDLTGAASVLWIIHYLGRSDASGRGLRSRLVLGFLLCALSASLGVTLLT